MTHLCTVKQLHRCPARLPLTDPAFHQRHVTRGMRRLYPTRLLGVTLDMVFPNKLKHVIRCIAYQGDHRKASSVAELAEDMVRIFPFQRRNHLAVITPGRFFRDITSLDNDCSNSRIQQVQSRREPAVTAADNRNVRQSRST